MIDNSDYLAMQTLHAIRFPMGATGYMTSTVMRTETLFIPSCLC